MKTLYEIINQPPIFLHDWTCAADVIADFQYGGASTLDIQEDDNILFASYGTDNWSGDAFVLYENHGVLYEVNGNHCSCYGLEGQWEREEVTLEVLK